MTDSDLHELVFPCMMTIDSLTLCAFSDPYRDLAVSFDEDQKETVHQKVQSRINRRQISLSPVQINVGEDERINRKR